MSKPTINRRQFFETSGRSVAGGVAVTLAPALFAAADDWAAELTAIDPQHAPVLLRLCRLLYPHDRLHDGYYASCVASLDVKAAADASLADQLREGVVKLGGEAFLALPEQAQNSTLQALENEPFFQAVRGHMVVALYTDSKVWAELGYEGPSFPYGGYLERGFDDIDWLPDA